MLLHILMTSNYGIEVVMVIQAKLLKFQMTFSAEFQTHFEMISK